MTYRIYCNVAFPGSRTTLPKVVRLPLIGFLVFNLLLMKPKQNSHQYHHLTLATAVIILFLAIVAMLLSGGSYIEAAASDVQVKQGYFLTNATSGPQIVTGVGFEPKAIIFYWTGNDTAAGTKDVVKFGVGVSAGNSGSHGSIGIRVEHVLGNYSAGASSTRESQIKIYTGDLGSAKTANAAVTGFTGDGFELNWLDEPGGTYIIHYFAVGGAGVVASAGEFLAGKSFSGATQINTGFRPDMVFMVSNGTKELYELAPVHAANFSLGFATGSSSQAVANFFFNNGGATSQVCSRERTDAVISMLTSSCSSYFLGDGFFTDDSGFTFRNSLVPDPFYVRYLAIGGASFKVGSFTKRTSVGTSSVVGLGFTPKGIFLASRNQPVNSSIAPHADFSIGSANSINSRGAIGVSAQALTTGLSTDRRTTTNKVYTHITSVAGALSNEADLVSLDEDGFTLNWTTADINANEIFYFAVGDPQPVSFPDLVQKNYRWYKDVNTKDPANNQAIAGENTKMNNLARGRTRQLRINVSSPAGIFPAGMQFKLQYQKNSTSSVGWKDLEDAASPFSGGNLSCCADGTIMSALRLSSSTVMQTYEENGLSAPTPSAIDLDEAGEWNWVIRNNLTDNATYYFRMVGGDGAELGSYVNYPAVGALDTNISSGELTSVIFDTKSIDGAQLNSFFWRGPQPEIGDSVKFQFASANKINPSGGWDALWKGPDGSVDTWYEPTGPEFATAITPGNHTNHRYFRYKIRLESSSGISPTVRRVIINWSP